MTEDRILAGMTERRILAGMTEHRILAGMTEQRKTRMPKPRNSRLEMSKWGKIRVD
jgi:hypothetical protein